MLGENGKPKISLEEAVDMATEELGGETEEKEVSESDEKSGEEEATDDASTESESEEEKSEDKGEEESSESVQQTEDEESDSETSGRREEEEGSPSGGAKESLVQQLLDELKARKTETSQKGPRDISEVDIQNPKDVQAWLDERVSHAVESVVGPIRHANAQREATLEIQELRQSHPDAHMYGKAMAKLIEQNPKLPLEHAYRIASYEASKRSGKQEALKSLSTKKKAVLAKDTAKPTPDGAKPVKSSRDAVLKAMDELGI